MATVTRKFRDDFETWAARKVENGDFTSAEMSEFRELLRRDLAHGPDTLREEPFAIDDPRERYRLWADYFAAENAKHSKLLPLPKGRA